MCVRVSLTSDSFSIKLCTKNLYVNSNKIFCDYKIQLYEKENIIISFSSQMFFNSIYFQKISYYESRAKSLYAINFPLFLNNISPPFPEQEIFFLFFLKWSIKKITLLNIYSLVRQSLMKNYCNFWIYYQFISLIKKTNKNEIIYNTNNLVVENKVFRSKKNGKSVNILNLKKVSLLVKINVENGGGVSDWKNEYDVQVEWYLRIFMCAYVCVRAYSRMI